MPIDFNRFQEIAQSLDSSPLFNFSLASKELFHSDFLKWLCDKYEIALAKLFSAYLDTPLRPTAMKAKRERAHADLLLQFNDSQELWIENKVKSIPSEKQLIEYSQKKTDGRSYLLLVLDDRALDPPVPWKLLLHRELGRRLLEELAGVIQQGSYDGFLIRDYVAFVRALSDLSECVGKIGNDPNDSFFLERRITDELERLRIHDLVGKSRYEQLARRVAEELKANGFSVAYDETKTVLDKGPSVDCWVWAGMTRGTPLCEMKVLLTKDAVQSGPVILGVQFQGKEFRLLVETAKGGNAEPIAAQLLKPQVGEKIWFNFAPIDSETTPRKPRQTTFNRFGKEFIYRAKPLGPVSGPRLAEMICGYATMVQAHKATLLQQVTNTCDESQLAHGAASKESS